VLAKRSSDLLHGLDAGTHGLTAPLVEKLPGPGGRAVIPELLECFLEKVGPDGLQVVAEEIAQSEALLGLQILFPLEQEPARLFQERCPAFARYAARFSGADLAPFAELIVTGRRQMARDQTATELLRGRTATSMLFLSALKWACWQTKPGSDGSGLRS
jgi:hypothetical protein